MNILYRIIRKFFGENILYQVVISKKTFYVNFFEKRSVVPMNIFAMDNRSFNHGFADRLRGIISIFAYSKAIGVPFRIDHQVPFRLEDFFVPNNYDWLFHEKEVSFNLKFSSPVVLRNYTKGYRLLLLRKNRQHFFYTNIDAIDLINRKYNTHYNYTELFQELFRPSELLLSKIKAYETYINEGYISISFRFMQLMGDFKDIMGKTLNQEERTILIHKCHEFIKSIHNQNLDYKHILVTSDSSTFMKTLKDINYVFSLPGEIGHTGFSNNKNAHLKTFLDFYMISKAQKVYMGYTGEMYKSHFAASAALTTGAEFHAIKF